MNSKKKGNAGELEMLRILEERGVPCQRNEQGLLAGFRGGFLNPDVGFTLGGRAYHGEVKRAERLNVYAAMDQAIGDSGGQAIPIVLHRRNRRGWLAVLTLDDFLRIAE